MQATLPKYRIQQSGIDNPQFLNDVVKGLSAKEKYLQSKYFYDEEGDKIFQQIMECPEYYLTKCELEIFKNKKEELASVFTQNLQDFDVVELGAGDASKSSYLLNELLTRKISFTYYPVDISKNVISFLQKELPLMLPGLKVVGLNGEYLNMLTEAKERSSRPKAILFLGSNIGNIPLAEANEFFYDLRSHLLPGDFVLIGFDLKKDPKIIVDAYNDKAGHTRRFNLNLLKRINKELDADFVIENFEHQPTYNAPTGECKSFLVSTKQQVVRVHQHHFYFAKGEKIYMEISQKYAVEEINSFAINNGFAPLENFYDSKKWFVDAVWKCV